jgi:hypothetical protein
MHMGIGQSSIGCVVANGHLFMIEPHEVEHGGVRIV